MSVWGWSRAIIANVRDTTSVDRSTGAVRSVQAADMLLPSTALAEAWSTAYLERLARTYWRFLTRVTLGLIRVRYTEKQRFVVLFFKPLTLLAFEAPEYELASARGLVRWRIARGLLVARRGRDPDGGGYLQIEVRRCPDGGSPFARLHVEVEVANFYPSIAGISLGLYNATQSRIHVIITNGFLRSLASLELARSHVARFGP